MNNKTKKVFKWLAVLPVFIGGFLIGGILINTFSYISNWFTGFEQGSGYTKIMYYIVSSAASGILSMYWGIKIAPSHKKIVALILEALIILLVASASIFSILYKMENLIWNLISCISCAVGAGYIIYQYYEKGDDFKLFE